MLTLILAVGTSVVVSALCSLLESVLYSTRLITVAAAEATHPRRADAMRLLVQEVDRPLAAILILNTLANTAGASLAGWAAGQIWGPHSLVVFSVAFTLAILLLSEIVPKTVGAVYWRVLWRWSVPMLEVMITFLTPLIWLTRMITRLIQKQGAKAKNPLVSEAEIVAAARLGQHGGEISKLEADMIKNIVGLEDIPAERIMTPRTVMFIADGNLPLSEVQAEARDWPFSRVPVYLDGPEDIVGYVLKNEVCRRQAPAEGPEPNLASLAQPARFVPPSANALNLLNLFLRRHEHLYLVVDEYGGIMGVVTLEDVLESLVGSEIVDEKDMVVDLQELARLRGREVLGVGRREE
ncbi:MAG: DUF21 domain-containing protein [Deltaproteobacteria bacterium]|nr:DUF21 domain-containing protein [Deltaproteobacteria bacterium]